VSRIEPGAKVVSDEDLLFTGCGHGLSSDLDLPDRQRFTRGGGSAARLRGIEGLRVVDARHAGPGIGQYQRPVIMIAEKASDMILQDAAQAP
jgi:hypothetical protein